jgi:hypothetical protein
MCSWCYRKQRFSSPEGTDEINEDFQSVTEILNRISPELTHYEMQKLYNKGTHYLKKENQAL